MNQYSVVRFKDGSASEVPTSWIIENGKECWWPNSKSVSQLIIKLVPPNTNTWTKHSVVIEVQSVSLETARKKAADCDYSTSDEIDPVLSKSKRKLTKRKDVIYEYDGEHETSGEDTLTDDDVDMPPKLNQFVNDDKMPPQLDQFVPAEPYPSHAATIIPCAVDLTEEDVMPSATTSTIVNLEKIPIHICENPSTPDSAASSVDQKLEKIMDVLLEIREELRSIKKEAIHNFPNQAEPIFAELKNLIPTQSVDGIKELEAYLQIGENKTILKKYIGAIGGNGPKDNITRIYKRLFLDSAAVNCSWLGQRSNFRLNNLICINLTQEVVYDSYQLREKEFETISAEWFRHANQRLKRKLDN